MVEYDRSSEFTAAELDLLEDALEDLTILPEGGSPELLGRIESFREILGLTEEALPPIEVPEGLLDSVLEEARRSPAVVIESEAAGTAGGLWQRLRRSLLLPGFALAATAALLIVVLRPDAPLFGDMSEKTGDAGATAKAEVPRERTDETRAAAEVEEEAPSMVPAAAPLVEEKADLEEEADEAIAADGATEEPPAPAYELKKRPAKSKKSAAPPKDAGAGLDDAQDAKASAEEELDAEDKEALRTLLQQADSDRQRGRCGAAVSAYTKLLGVRGNEEARALMGLGLCAEREGDMTAAEGYYRRAKAINPALESLISAERKRLGAAGSEPSRKKAVSKPKAKKALPFE